MHVDPSMPIVMGLLFGVLSIALLLRRFKQPYVVAYLLAGVVLGPHGLSLVTDETTIAHVGSFGVLLLLFFIGMEISPTTLAANWKVSVLGTILQIVASLMCTAALGFFLDWPIGRVVLIGFVLSLSSTALVIKILQEWHEQDTPSAQDVIGILLMQDIAIVPMFITLGLLRGGEVSLNELVLQVIAAIGVLALVAFLLSRKTPPRMPFRNMFAADTETQVFAALIICFGLSFLTGICGLSSALGAFLGGMVVAATRETSWVHTTLEPFRIVFVALFFVSIGMLVDLAFLRENWGVALFLVLISYVVNTGINAGVIRILGRSWREALYSALMLSQIGEFSFVLVAVGKQAELISDYGYNLTLSVIAINLLLSPAWISIARRRLKLLSTSKDIDKKATVAPE